MSRAPYRFGFVSTRFAGTDGVSLEAAKWARVLEELGGTCLYFAGECDRPADVSRVVPEAHFTHPDVDRVNRDLFSGSTRRSHHTTNKIHELRETLRRALIEFVNDFEVHVLVVENALAIPMNVPLGLAITEVVAETGIPTIAHHHDFAWERSRFAVNGAADYLQAAFPPAMSNVRHVVINSYAARELARRTGLRAEIVPNVMDFDHPPERTGRDPVEFRRRLGLDDEDLVLLQPTRVVPRKCIERAVDLSHRLGVPNAVVVTHESGDEGQEYEEYLADYAEGRDVRLLFAADAFVQADFTTGNAANHADERYTLPDAYQLSDLVTYPSSVEGFGNAFLEAVYYQRPLFTSAYDIFRMDIEPKGFHVVAIESFVTSRAVERVRGMLENGTLTESTCRRNFEIGRRHYSFSVLRDSLAAILDEYVVPERLQGVGSGVWSSPLRRT